MELAVVGLNRPLTQAVNGTFIHHAEMDQVRYGANLQVMFTGKVSKRWTIGEFAGGRQNIGDHGRG